MRTTKIRSKFSLLFIALAALIAIPAAVAFADNVQNDVVVGGNDSFVEGGSTTINYRIASNNGDGEAGCNATSASPATVNIIAPTGVTAAPSSLSFTSCGDDKAVVFSSSTSGDYGITASVSDSGTGTYNVNPAKFTLHVNDPPPPSDSTPPVITKNVSGTLGSNGWYTSDVTVTWLATDSESEITSTPCPATTISSDTLGQTVSCSATSAGGTSTESVTIKRDATNPTISGSASPAANSFGWNNEAVTVDFTCNDDTSGVPASSCGPDETLSSEGANQSSTGTATDNAGNSDSTTVSNINIDKTKPTVALVDGPSNGSSHYFGSVPAAPTCTASDALSTLDNSSGDCQVSGYSNLVGTHTVTATAKDKAGNTQTAESTYTVNPWSTNGFFQPVDMNGVYNTVKGGSTVPMKFEAFAGTTELTDPATTIGTVGTNGTINDVKVTKISCAPGGTEDLVETTVSGNTVLRYDTTAGQFIFNWKSPTGAGNCYKVTVPLKDGSSLTAYFKLK